MIVLKREGVIEQTPIDKWSHQMMFVNTTNDFLESVELIMKNEYIPQFSALNSLESDDKREFLFHLQRFMCITTDYCFQRKGQTRLYIPKENLSEHALNDKDLEQRLENIMNSWNQQIANEMSSENKKHLSDNFICIDKEIKFWDKRRNNLASLSGQLKNKELIKI